MFTPASLIDDSQVSIAVGEEVYEPRNYHETFHGEVTARYALAMSLNNATVRLAQEVGFDKVAALAKSAGIRSVRANAGNCVGRLRRHSAGDGGRLHGVCQQRHTALAADGEVGTRREGQRARQI